MPTGPSPAPSSEGSGGTLAALRAKGRLRRQRLWQSLLGVGGSTTTIEVTESSFQRTRDSGRSTMSTGDEPVPTGYLVMHGLLSGSLTMGETGSPGPATSPDGRSDSVGIVDMDDRDPIIWPMVQDGPMAVDVDAPVSYWPDWSVVYE